jgi:hypothetical protein
MGNTAMNLVSPEALHSTDEAPPPPVTEVDSTVNLDSAISFDEIMAANDITYKEFPVPEWGENRVIRLRVLTAAEALKFSKDMKDAAKKDDAIARIVMLCAVNPDGSKMMQSDKHLQLFKNKSIVVIQRLQREAMILNGFLDKDGNPVDSATREALAKNV